MADDTTFLTQGNEAGYDDYDGMGVGEEIHVSESTRLHKKMREMKLMDDKLATMKNDYAQRIRVVKLGEARFLEKQKNTIEYLRKFKAFIIETDTKRMRAEKNYWKKKKQIQSKEAEIRQLRIQLQDKRDLRDRKLRQHERTKINQSFLDKVLAISDQYTEIEELLTRYRILRDTNEDLGKVAEQVSKDMEELQRQIQALVKNKQNEILVRNSRLAHLQQQHEEKSNSTSTLENESVGAELKNKEMSRKFGEIQMAIRNIHTRTMSYPTTPSLMKKQEQHNQQTKQSVKPVKPTARKKNNDDDENNDSETTSQIKNEELLANLVELLEVISEKVFDITKVAAVGKDYSLPRN